MSDDSPTRYSPDDTPEEAWKKGRRAYQRGVFRRHLPSSYARKPKLLAAWRHGWDDGYANSTQKSRDA